MKYLHINTGQNVTISLSFSSATASLQFNTLCMMQYFVIEIYFFLTTNIHMFIYKNLWILPTNRKCTIFCTQVFPVLKKHLILNNTMKDEGNTQK